MVGVVFCIGVLNLCIGFALSVYLSRTGMAKVRAEDFLDQLSTPEPQVEPRVEEAAPEEPEPEPEEVPVTAEIPNDWMDMLEEENVVAGSFVEASVQVLRLEVGKYRDELIAIDRQVRECREQPEALLIKSLLAELKEVNEDWLKQQAEAADHLSSNTGNLGDLESMGAVLSNVLMDQAAQIETMCSNVDHLDFESDIPAGCTRLVTEIRKLIDLAHSLRDTMLDSLLGIVKAEGRLHTIDKRLQIDALTGIHNRSGLETVFDDLWREDPQRIRQISCGMVDLDRFSRLLEEHGAIRCDRLLRAFSTLLVDLVRKDRGFDVAARFSGQRFLTFFADTGPQNATSAIERIRQTVERTTFELDGIDIDLTVSCAVAEVQGDEKTESLYDRLNKAIRHAKKEGRNCTVLDDGNGPHSVDAPEYDVSGKIIRVGV
jgi:diguanylate cyclase (GGDEF)-like protein